MSLRTRREIVVTPGPTMIPDEVLGAMHRPTVDLYSEDLHQVTLSCLADLRQIFRSAGDVYIYAAIGHGAWEAALSNSLSRGDKVLVLESGQFAKGWGEMGQMLGLTVETLAGIKVPPLVTASDRWTAARSLSAAYRPRGCGSAPGCAKR